MLCPKFLRACPVVGQCCAIARDAAMSWKERNVTLDQTRDRRPEYAVSGSGGTVDLDHLLSSSRSSAGGEVPWPHSSFDGSLGGATPRRSSDGPSLFADHRCLHASEKEACVSSPRLCS